MLSDLRVIGDNVSWTRYNKWWYLLRGLGKVGPEFSEPLPDEQLRA